MSAARRGATWAYHCIVCGAREDWLTPEEAVRVADRHAAGAHGIPSAGPIDEVPGVERDPAFVSSARPASSTAGLSALRHRVRRDR